MKEENWLRFLRCFGLALNAFLLLFRNADKHSATVLVVLIVHRKRMDK